MTVIIPGMVGSCRVAESPRTLMNISNLSKVFGPTLVGYSKADPEPMQMMKETNCGQKVPCI